MVDAGSGIRDLGRRILDEDSREVTLLLTHLHWDHLLGFPFFLPIYQPGWRVNVTGCPRAMEGLTGLFDTHHGDGYFPVRFEGLPARVQPTKDYLSPTLSLGSIRVRTVPLNHPQGGLGYRFAENGESWVFLTDNELNGPAPRKLDDYARFCQGAQVLIHDAQYLPQEMVSHQGWGHSSWDQAVKLAEMAGARRLILIHHDPGRTDDQIDDLLAQARAAAPPGLQVDAAYEGLTLTA